MKSSERRLKLTLLLQQPGGKKLTVDELANRFDVSRRTIFRDLRALQEIEVPVTWDRYSGYGIMKGYKIPPLMFTAKELATVMVGLSFVKSQVDKYMVEDARAVQDKIKNVLPGELKDFMNSLDEKTIVDPYLKFSAEKREGGNWYLINSAISQQKRISFSYKSRDGKITDRKIDPYLLVFYQDHWNIIGYSHKRSDFRNFIIENVKDIEILEENYTPKPKVTAEGLIFRPDEGSHEIVLEVSEKGFKRLKRNLPTKILKQSNQKNKKIKVSFEFDNLDYINRWLLQYGEEIKIISPKELLKKRRVLLEKLLEMQ